MGEVFKEIKEIGLSWMNRVGESEMSSRAVTTAALTKTGKSRNWDHFQGGERRWLQTGGEEGMTECVDRKG